MKAIDGMPPASQLPKTRKRPASPEPASDLPSPFALLAAQPPHLAAHGQGKADGQPANPDRDLFPDGDNARRAPRRSGGLPAEPALSEPGKLAALLPSDPGRRVGLAGPSRHDANTPHGWRRTMASPWDLDFKLEERSPDSQGSASGPAPLSSSWPGPSSSRPAEGSGTPSAAQQILLALDSRPSRSHGQAETVIRIALKPDHLGHVEIRISVANGIAAVRISAETIESVQALERDRDTIESFLAAHGIDLGPSGSITIDCRPSLAAPATAAADQSSNPPSQHQMNRHPDERHPAPAQAGDGKVPLQPGEQPDNAAKDLPPDPRAHRHGRYI